MHFDLNEKTKQVVLDALAEFVKTRTPVTSYVQHRYSDHEDAFVVLKAQNVSERVKTAQELMRQIRGA